MGRTTSVLKEKHVKRIAEFSSALVRRTGRTESEGKRATQESGLGRQDSGGTAEVSDRRETHQGRNRAVQRPRRPAAHARLRQEVSVEELGQSHIRRLLHSWLHRAT